LSCCGGGQASYVTVISGYAILTSVFDQLFEFDAAGVPHTCVQHVHTSMHEVVLLTGVQSCSELCVL
jgi:hypothetical protein